MGWKALTEHYELDALHVKVDGDDFIVSTGLEDVIFDRNGKLKKNDVARGEYSSANTRRFTLIGFVIAVEANVEKFKELFAKEDTFANSIDIYTFKGGEVLKKQCEEFKPLTLTHDGEVIYENTHWATFDEALDAGIRSHKASIEWNHLQIESLRSELSKCQDFSVSTYADLAKLYKIKEGVNSASV